MRKRLGAVFSRSVGVVGLSSGQRTSLNGLRPWQNNFSLAKREENPDLLIRAHESAGSTYSFLGRFDEAKAHLLRQVPVRSHSTSLTVLPYAQDPGITARIMLARTLWILGEVDQVETLLRKPSAWRESWNTLHAGVYFGAVAWISSTLRDTDRTLSLADEAVAFRPNTRSKLGWPGRCPRKVGRCSKKVGKKVLNELVNGLSATQAANASLNNTYTLALLADSICARNALMKG